MVVKSSSENLIIRFGSSVEIVVPVARVREDVLAHATQTFAFASLLVVADHHHLRHHSFVLA